MVYWYVVYKYTPVNNSVGLVVGLTLGRTVGAVGRLVGFIVGLDGVSVGEGDGISVQLLLGREVGLSV